MSQGGWTQYAVRGRGGRGSQPNRGGHPSSRHCPILMRCSPTGFRRSGGSKQLDPTMPLGTSAHSASSAPSSSPSREAETPTIVRDCRKGGMLTRNRCQQNIDIHHRCVFRSRRHQQRRQHPKRLASGCFGHGRPRQTRHFV